jgi:thiamine pyrophosphokinase
LGGDALGVTTHGLEFPLHEEVLLFGATRGISNVFRTKNVRIDLKQGLLVCIISHQE